MLKWLLFQFQAKNIKENKLDSEQDSCLPKKR